MCFGIPGIVVTLLHSKIYLSNLVRGRKNRGEKYNRLKKNYKNDNGKLGTGKHFNFKN